MNLLIKKVTHYLSNTFLVGPKVKLISIRRETMKQMNKIMRTFLLKIQKMNLQYKKGILASSSC